MRESMREEGSDESSLNAYGVGFLLLIWHS